MEFTHILGEDLPVPPTRLFERLALLPGYTWDQSIEPFHSSYNSWHVFGIRHSEFDASTPAATSSGPSSLARNSPRADTRPALRRHARTQSSSESSSDSSDYHAENEAPWMSVIARVSSQVVRLEREFHMLKSIVQSSDPDCNHTIRPVGLMRLPSDRSDTAPILVAIYESPGSNMLRELVAFGPAWFAFGDKSDSSNGSTPGEQVSLSEFLDFAIGACDCLELLHYGLKAVHGEIRGDAFHFNRDTQTVKLTNAGNGPRSFDNVLSEGWSSVSRELGVKNKLQFIAPEQTGRTPTEPDSRTDIYSLGVLFWTMLVGRPAFNGSDPVEVVQNVLGRKLPAVSTKRMDIPDAVSAVIQKMTRKAVDERYHTISSVKRDLSEISSLLGDGNSDALERFQIAQHDVSSFFTLPSHMFGRREEYDKIINVVEKVKRRQQTALSKVAAHSPSGFYNAGSNSSMSESRLDTLEVASGSSDSGSAHLASKPSPVGGSYHLARVATQESLQSSESSISTQRPGHNYQKARSPVDSRSSWDNSDRDSQLHANASTQTHVDTVAPLGRHRLPKLRSGGRSEVITISGAAGLGKTDLLNRVQPAIRKLGYIAVARLDRAQRVPYEPFAKALASLLRQIFSERDVTTDYHDSIRAALRSIWPTLHKVLELPEQLMSPGAKTKQLSPKPSATQHLMKEFSVRGESQRRVTFPSLDGDQSSADFFLSNAASKNMRLLETFLEILRTLSQFKLVCVCLDDVHYADTETLDLIMNIVKAKLPCVLILTSHKAELASDTVKSLFEAEGPNMTRIVLHPLRENEVMQFVAETMHSEPSEKLSPLAAVIRDQSGGNPFYVRMMLETCYSKNCIWYSWKNSKWEFDLDRIFTEFVSPQYGEGLGLSFIAKRLLEIPPASRSILVWASLLGNPFSFSLVQKLLTSKFLYSSKDDDVADLTCPGNADLIRLSEAALVVGLQYLVQIYLITPGETDDEFRFANDRLSQAAASMREGRNVEKMHFIISQTMMEYYHDGRSRYAMARHIALASQLIKSRVRQRIDYRRILWDAARTAAQSGARPTALWYFRHCMDLLQDDPWDDSRPDVYYDETLRLHIAMAEMLFSQGSNNEAVEQLDVVFARGRTAVCKSRAWVVRAKVYAQTNDHPRAMDCLLTCLEELGVDLRGPTSYEQCDVAYQRLRAYMQKVDLDEVAHAPVSGDISMVTIGAVMAEAMAVTFWDDALTFYRMAIEMMKLHLFKGGFVQVSIGCSHLSMIALSRFRDLELATKLTSLGMTLFQRCPEPFTRTRASIAHNLYVSHLRSPISSILPDLEVALEASYAMGDPYIVLTGVCSMAMARLFLGQDMAQLETFCNEGPEDYPDWTSDTRGGVGILVIRQIARALQGKTSFTSAEGVISDEHHSTHEFIAFLNAHASNPDRPHDIYRGLSMMALFIFGHKEKVIKVGRQMMESIPRLWSVRVAYAIYFYMALSYLTLHIENYVTEFPNDDMEFVLSCKEVIDFARSACDTNYAMWSFMLEALIAEVQCDYPSVVQAYEACIDHCQINGFPLSEAIGLELYGEFLMRRGAKRPARAAIQESLSAWSSISAAGKVVQLSEKHEWLLKTATTSRAVDTGCQTVNAILDIGRNPEEEQIAISQANAEEDERKQRWIQQNEVVAGERSLDISSVGLDIIDLTSILESSQVMSSELQMDKLFTKMIVIILESCNSSDFAVIATDSDDTGFTVAATGDSESGAKAFSDGLTFSRIEDKMAQQISEYVLRTREGVLVHNVLEDERFSNVSEAYQTRYPYGRSVIALPILQAENLLGVIHIEGKPNSFTQRNVVVLHLLCNQIGISLSNALLFREIRRVSATNASMVEAQKRALSLARDAEAKAKVAEAEANHNVKLRDDAARAKSIFLANISHDLRTPMNGVIGLSELLKGTQLGKEQDDYVESIRVCADTLLTLINDVLDFSKLEAGKMKISTVPLNLKETISEVVRALRYTHRDRRLETIEDLDGVPPDLVVLGDPVRLHQIFMNLLSNSYKFTPKGSVTARARVCREAKGRVRLECSVSDTGIGISEEQKTRLFRPFSQADNSTARSYGGSGLGLSICKAIIEDVLGGAIWLDSAPGVGTTVTFHLVLNKAPKDTTVKAPWSHDLHQVESKEPPRPAVRDLTSIPRDQIRVCIAEDNPINQKIAVKFVTGLGLRCEAYSDGGQALEALRARSKEGIPFHVVLMDVQMPILDGYNATHQLRKDPDPNVNEVLVIAMTASAIEGDREKCLAAGMNNYLPKPVRSPILSDMLDHYLAPVPSFPKSKLAVREKKLGSVTGENRAPTSFSSGSSGSSGANNNGQNNNGQVTSTTSTPEEKS